MREKGLLGQLNLSACLVSYGGMKSMVTMRNLSSTYLKPRLFFD
jgi:hypothetical protein